MTTRWDIIREVLEGGNEGEVRTRTSDESGHGQRGDNRSMWVRKWCGLYESSLRLEERVRTPRNQPRPEKSSGVRLSFLLPGSLLGLEATKTLN